MKADSSVPRRHRAMTPEQRRPCFSEARVLGSSLRRSGQSPRFLPLPELWSRRRGRSSSAARQRRRKDSTEGQSLRMRPGGDPDAYGRELGPALTVSPKEALMTSSTGSTDRTPKDQKPAADGDAASCDRRKVIDALASAGEATVDEVVTAAGIGRTSGASISPISGAAERPNASRAVGTASAKCPTASCSSLQKGPCRGASRGCEGGASGGLDELVLSYIRDHTDDTPFSPTAVAKRLGRSSGAVGNCLSLLSKAGELVIQVSQQPRRYASTGKDR